MTPGHEQRLVACPECGGNCAPECGRHPAGCVYGGWGYGYWMVADGCDRSHGEDEGRSEDRPTPEPAVTHSHSVPSAQDETSPLCVMCEPSTTHGICTSHIERIKTDWVAVGERAATHRIVDDIKAAAAHEYNAPSQGEEPLYATLIDLAERAQRIGWKREAPVQATRSQGELSNQETTP